MQSSVRMGASPGRAGRMENVTADMESGAGGACGKRSSGSPYTSGKEIAMAKARNWRIGRGLAALFASLALLHAVPVLAQETPDQFDAANAENRRHTQQQNQFRNQAHDLRTDR